MDCANCGAPLKEGSRFCTACGAAAEGPGPVQPTVPMPPVGAPPVAQPQYAPAPAQPPATPPAPKRGRGMTVAIVIVVIGALVMCCGVGGFFGWRFWSSRQKATTGSGSTKSGSGAGGTASGDDSGGTTGGTGTDAGTGGDSGDTIGGDDTPQGEPDDISGSAVLSASSSLPANSKADYYPANLIDGDSTTCWAEGKTAKGDYGIGQTVTFTFPTEVTVSAVRVIPGYDKYDSNAGVDRWYSNGRVKTARLRFSDGSASGVFSFSDSDRGLQEMALTKPVKTTYVTFEIVSVFPADTGTNRDASDTSISEMRVMGWLE